MFLLAAFALAGCPSDPCPAPRITYMNMCVSRCPSGSGLCGADGAVIPGTEDASAGDAIVDTSVRDAEDAAVTGDASDIGATIPCDGGMVSKGRCIYTQTDPANCGRSGNVCPSGPGGRAVCVAGVCAVECAAGFEVVSGQCDVRVPRPIAPMSTSYVTSRRPVFKWESPAFVDGAVVEICRTRACAAGEIVQTITATGTQAAASADLTRGVWFWRLRGRVGTTAGTRSGPVWQLTSNERSAPIVTSWGSTLDVNGDGFADIAVGAPGRDGDAAVGRVHLYMGRAGGPMAMAAVTLSPPVPIPGFGFAVASAGDMNGDGLADLIVGSSRFTGSAPSPGHVVLYLGSVGGLSPMPMTFAAPEGVDGRFGFSVAGAGDLDGDGYGDALIGAPDLDANNGRVYILLGGATTFNFAATSIAGTDPGGRFGASVAGAGDVNGDGFPDVVIGANLANMTGRAFLYYGGLRGLTRISTSLDGRSNGNQFGAAVTGAGDVNGDGLTDVLVAAPADPSIYDGRAFLYLGTPSSLATVPTPMSSPNPGNASFGRSLSSAGDVNGDGYSDVFVGESRFTSGTGHAYVYTGSATGLAAAPAGSFTAPGATISSSFGMAVTGVGDVNGDGFQDMLVGEPVRDRAVLYPGGAAGVMATPQELTSMDGTGRFFGFSVASLARRRGIFGS